jgi:hypothetical protein
MRDKRRADPTQSKVLWPTVCVPASGQAEPEEFRSGRYPEHSLPAVSEQATCWPRGRYVPTCHTPARPDQLGQLRLRTIDDFRNLMRGDTARGCELGQDAGESLDADAFEFVSQSVITLK